MNKTTRFYEFLLPDRDNAGIVLREERRHWEAHALARAGGFTWSGVVQGSWRDDQMYVQTESMHRYSVACDRIAFQCLLTDAFELFPDQVAIFAAEIGRATIHRRQDHEQPSR